MGNGNKVEFFVAVCALFSSIIAIWVAWDQSRVMRAQQDGMVFPVLQINGFVSTEEETVSMGVNIENSGVGPALIEAVRAFDREELIETLEPYRENLAPGYNISWTGLTGRAVAPGKEFDAISLEWPRENITQAQLNRSVLAWGELDFEICYCSVFQKCWVTKMETVRAKQVDACDPSPKDIFEEFGMARVSAPPPPKQEAS
ncbi:MAG: hypothetical protein AAGG79_06850 [Pseudomonadota bacterium]